MTGFLAGRLPERSRQDPPEAVPRRADARASTPKRRSRAKARPTGWPPPGAESPRGHTPRLRGLGGSYPRAPWERREQNSILCDAAEGSPRGRRRVCPESARGGRIKSVLFPAPGLRSALAKQAGACPSGPTSKGRDGTAGRVMVVRRTRGAFLVQARHAGRRDPCLPRACRGARRARAAVGDFQATCPRLRRLPQQGRAGRASRHDIRISATHHAFPKSLICYFWD